MSVHDRTWHFDCSFPIKVIETEVISHFLEFLETQLDLMQQNTVVGRSSTTLSLSLSNHEEVGIFGLDHVLINNKSALSVITRVVLKNGESLLDSLGTDQKGDFRAFSGESFLEHVHDVLELVFEDDFLLPFRDTISIDDDIFRGSGEDFFILVKMGGDNGGEVFDDFFVLSEFLGGGVDVGEVRPELGDDSGH